MFLRTILVTLLNAYTIVQGVMEFVQLNNTQTTIWCAHAHKAITTVLVVSMTRGLAAQAPFTV